MKDKVDLKNFKALSYNEVAFNVLGLFLNTNSINFWPIKREREKRRIQIEKGRKA
jgi:hypothetical protein